MKRYTVKQLAELSGVSVRTLHHYDAIGLLTPAYVGDNGYRYYGENELLRLQQILLHRELGFPLKEIAAILDEPGFDRLAALETHKTRLEAEAERYRRLVRTIDRTIAEIKGRRAQGDWKMKHADLYSGFAPEKQEEYEHWLVERYGDEMRAQIETSRAKYASLSSAEKEQAGRELAEIESDLAENCRRAVPPDSPALGPALERHRAWVAYMWGRSCPPEAYSGLAEPRATLQRASTRFFSLSCAPPPAATIPRISLPRPLPLQRRSLPDSQLPAAPARACDSAPQADSSTRRRSNHRLARTFGGRPGRVDEHDPRIRCSRRYPVLFIP